MLESLGKFWPAIRWNTLLSKELHTWSTKKISKVCILSRWSLSNIIFMTLICWPLPTNISDLDFSLKLQTHTSPCLKSDMPKCNLVLPSKPALEIRDYCSQHGIKNRLSANTKPLVKTSKRSKDQSIQSHRRHFQEIKSFSHRFLKLGSLKEV